MTMHFSFNAVVAVVVVAVVVDAVVVVVVVQLDVQKKGEQG